MEFKLNGRFDHVCLPIYRLNWDLALESVGRPDVPLLITPLKKAGMG
jgi:hypothetical protein